MPFVCETVIIIDLVSTFPLKKVFWGKNFSFANFKILIIFYTNRGKLFRCRMKEKITLSLSLSLSLLLNSLSLPLTHTRTFLFFRPPLPHPSGRKKRRSETGSFLIVKEEELWADIDRSVPRYWVITTKIIIKSPVVFIVDISKFLRS